MTTPRDPDEILSAWLDEGPTRLPDQTRRAISVAIPTTTQRRRAMRAPWRYFDMTTAPKFALAATAVVAVVLGGAFLIKPPASGSDVGGATTSPTTAAPSVAPSAATSPSPIASAPWDTTAWLPFSSDRYGYDMSYPPTWTVTPATSDWSLEADRSNEMLTKAADNFLDPGNIIVTAHSAPVPVGMSNEDWLAAYNAPESAGAIPTGCTPIDQFEAITVDGQPGLLNPDACDASQAFVFIGDRVYLFTAYRPDQVPLLKGFLSTVRFQPVAAAPIDTSDWVPFSSDRYGYDLSYPSGWTATPATSDWSLEADRTTDWAAKAADQFLDTAAAYGIGVTAFTAPVPAGMSDEDWLAAYNAPYSDGSGPTGCTPIDQFEAVTVDGQPGLLNPDACDASQAFVFIGDQVHVFSAWRPDEVPLLKGFLSTVKFQPGG